MPQQHVIVLYNQPLLPKNHPDAESEHTIVDIAHHIGTTLEKENFRTSMLGLKQDPTVLWSELRRRKPAAVFNLFEGSLDHCETESYVAGLLEWKDIPFTGSTSATLTMARAKDFTKHLFRGAGLPTADYFVVDDLPVPLSDLGWPVIVKPARQDASIGMDQDSVCTDQEQLENRVQYILDTYGPPVLIEEFIDGREFNVALVELPNLTVLPPSEIVFHRKPGLWPILTYNGKWRRDTAEYDATPPKFPADITPRLAERLSVIATRAYRLLGCRDYARVDFRVRPNGKPYILEVNPNPEISDDAGFAGCLGAANFSYNQFIVQLVMHAMNRPKLQLPHFDVELYETLQTAN